MKVIEWNLSSRILVKAKKERNSTVNNILLLATCIRLHRLLANKGVRVPTLTQCSAQAASSGSGGN